MTRYEGTRELRRPQAFPISESYSRGVDKGSHMSSFWALAFS